MKPRVLVVDDDIEFAELIEFNLGLEGCDSFAAHTGVKGLRAAKAELPDAILLDVMLPDLDGLSVCQILNSQPTTRDIPVFMLTALDESWAETRKAKARYAGFFTKPVDLKVLRERVHAAAQEHFEQAASHPGRKDAIRNLTGENWGR